MANNGSALSNTDWPLPAFSFQVAWGPHLMSFQEVSGLNTEARVTEYRAGNSPTHAPIKMPGLAALGLITLKRGLAPNDPALWRLLNPQNTNTAQPSTVTIRLLDDHGKPAMTWTLAQAMAIKAQMSVHASGGNEVAIETLEVRCAEMSVTGA